MKLQYHIAASTTVSGSLYLISRSWPLAIASFIAGIFIDLDHIFDVIREHGWSVKIRDFFHICNTAQFYRIILIWHGWEWLLLGLAMAWLTDWNPWVTGVFIGLSQHMVLDALNNSPGFLSYSLLWRWKHQFDYDTIFGKRLPRQINHNKY